MDMIFQESNSIQLLQHYPMHGNGHFREILLNLTLILIILVSSGRYKYRFFFDVSLVLMERLVTKI